MQERSATKRPYDGRGGVRDDPYYESKRPAMSDRYQYNVHLMCAATALNGHASLSTQVSTSTRKLEKLTFFKSVKSRGILKF